VSARHFAGVGPVSPNLDACTPPAAKRSQAELVRLGLLSAVLPWSVGRPGLPMCGTERSKILTAYFQPRGGGVTVVEY